MAQKTIPQELIDLAIDEVANDKDKQGSVCTLRSCALASSAFLARARKHLFEKVILNESEDDGQQKPDRSKLRRLLQILKYDTRARTLPPLAVNIKILVINLSASRALAHRNPNGSSLPRSTSIGAGIEIKPSKFMKRRPSSLPSILCELTSGVRVFTVSAPDGCSISWQAVDGLTRAALLRFISSRSIGDIRLRGIDDFPMNMFYQLPKLTSLSLSDMKSPDLHSSLSVAKHYLESSLELVNLAVIRSPEILNHLVMNKGTGTSSIPLSSISGFQVSISSNICSLDLIWDFVRTRKRLSCLSILEIPLGMGKDHPFTRYYRHLMFPVSFGAETAKSFMKTLDIGSLKRLSHLEIDCRFGGSAENVGLCPLTHWMLFNPRDTSAAPSSIKTLVITGEWDNCKSGFEDRYLRPLSGWNSIDGVLSNRSRFPRLAGVRCVLVLNYEHDVDISDKNLPAMERNFSRLVDIQRERLLPTLLRVESGIKVDISVTLQTCHVRRLTW